jgi:N-acetylglucosaminyldiphosphoundecaprenol N-acetyl-beta-D-mannosaminyltransferase
VGGLDGVELSRQELVDTMLADIGRRRRPGAEQRPVLVFDANAHAVSLAATDPAYAAAMGAADIIHADGGLIVLASRRGGQKGIRERSCTTDVFADFCEAAQANAMNFFLVGGDESLNAACAAKVRADYPGLEIAGRHHGFFSEKEEESVVDRINAANPDILWVGMGKPLERQL